MPYEWITHPDTAPEKSGAVSPYAKGPRPLAELHLWPYRSLPRKGFVITIGLLASLLTLPLLALLGTLLLWGMLPFLVATVAGVWWGLARSYRSGAVVEVLRIWPDRALLLRHEPRRAPRLWHANPYWVGVTLYQTGGPVPDYLTLTGGPREVELGAFLTPEERRALRPELDAVFAACRTQPGKP
ncbi:DUF2244 domain-containing protein [Phaeovulum sp.]|uniref:DUF2244 domain-containing protein n=1 Tax=Phaeovulum sp. TaxID=2934796 RepID=UPI0039E2ACB5